MIDTVTKISRLLDSQRGGDDDFKVGRRRFGLLSKGWLGICDLNSGWVNVKLSKQEESFMQRVHGKKPKGPAIYVNFNMKTGDHGDVLKAILPGMDEIQIVYTPLTGKELTKAVAKVEKAISSAYEYRRRHHETARYMP